MAFVKAINISLQKGTIKTPIAEGELIENFGLAGDAHGGPWHRQVSLLAQESIDKMTALGVADLAPGMFAENITTEGLTLHTLPVGTRLQIGSALAEVTQIGKHCHQHCDIFRQIGQCIMPTEGIFVRVLSGATVRAGDEIIVTMQA